MTPNAERQRAWRARRRDEVQTLRALRNSNDDRPDDDPLVARVLAATSDRTWHRLSAIVTTVTRGLDVTEADVLAVLEAMRLRGAYRAVAERRDGATGTSYRVLAGKGRVCDMDIVLAEVTPLLDALAAEGKKNLSTMSPGAVAKLTEDVRRTLHRLCR